MPDLNAQWYNAVVEGLRLQPDRFQLVQSSEPLGESSEALWKYFNSLPSVSATSFFQDNEIANFGQEYRAMVNNLASHGDDELKQVLGSAYGSWSSYHAAHRGQPLLQLFKQWANDNLDDPSQAQAAITTYQQSFSTTQSLAEQMMSDLTNGDTITAPVYPYNVSYASVLQLLSHAPGATVQMDSSHTRTT